MKTHWHALSFRHDCGREATILEVAAKSDGVMVFAGICTTCGEELSQEFRIVDVLATCAILDYKTSLQESPLEQFENFVPKGKPS